MLARIAHELYWLGRNVARAEHTARMLEGIYQADLQGRPDDPVGVTLSWGALLAIMGAGGGVIAEGPGPGIRERALTTLTLDPDSRLSVASSVARAREGARTVRDVISAEMWEAINTFHLGFADGVDTMSIAAGPYSMSSYVKARCALFWGVAGRTMLRDEAYAFLEAGGRFESADMVLRMLRVALPPGPAVEGEASPVRDGQALALLQAVGGLQAYRRAVAAPPNAIPVARFLLYTRSYPDSVAASVDAVRVALSAADNNPRSSEPVLRLSRLSADLEFRGGAPGEDGELLEVCEIVGRELSLTDHDVSERYFGGAHAGETYSTSEAHRR
jgi:uncharacterized alpha-E superfamily protein